MMLMIHQECLLIKELLYMLIPLFVIMVVIYNQLKVKMEFLKLFVIVGKFMLKKLLRKKIKISLNLF